jgi:hypothetical protein
LLDLFPGRTLEELDQMDLNRLYRAKIAKGMERVEDRRKLFLAGKLEPTQLDAGEWTLITEMDALAATFDDGG